MSKWTKLPIEILGIIFNDYIDSSSQLAECRLVCRSWDSTAEAAMLGKPLNLERVKTSVFYEYISKKSALAKHIKDITPRPEPCYGSRKNPEETELRIKLWKIILNENLRSITGEISDIDVFGKVGDIIEESPSKFAKLKHLDCSDSNAPVYINLVRLLSETLQQVSISEDVIDLLDQLENLEILNYSAYLHDGSLQAWENVLGRCNNNLKTIRIQFERGEEIEEPLESLTSEEVQTWVHRHQVQQLDHVKSLEYKGESFGEDWSPTICEYLLYKFPKLESVKFVIPYYVDPKDEKFTRLVTAVKAVEKHCVIYNIIPPENLDFQVDVGKAKDGNDNKMTIVWASRRQGIFVNVDSQQHSTNIEISLPSYANTQALSLSDIKHSTEFSSLKLNFRKATGITRNAEQNLMMCEMIAMFQDPYFKKNKPRVEDNYQDSNVVTQNLVQALTAFQHMRTMEIWVYQLTLEMTKQLPIHHELTNLEIVDALIESDAFSTFSVCLPSLKYLTLSSCTFANGDAANDNNSIWINLEQHSLTTLTFMDDRNRGRFEKNPQGKIYTPTLFHLESTVQQTDVYLMLLPIHTIPLTIHKEQFEMWSKQPHTIINISCGSIDTIIIRLGHISHALDIKKYMSS